MGKFPEGIWISEQARHIAENVGQSCSLTMAYLGAGTHFLRRGEFSNAVSNLEEALDHYSRTEVPIWYFVTASHLGYALVLSGKVAEGYQLLE